MSVEVALGGHLGNCIVADDGSRSISCEQLPWFCCACAGPLERPQAFAEMLHEVLADCIADESKDAPAQGDCCDRPKL